MGRKKNDGSIVVCGFRISKEEKQAVEKLAEKNSRNFSQQVRFMLKNQIILEA